MHARHLMLTRILHRPASRGRCRGKVIYTVDQANRKAINTRFGWHAAVQVRAQRRPVRYPHMPRLGVLPLTRGLLRKTLPGF